MITAVHSLIYSDDPDATRAFLRDVLGWDHVEHRESGDGWLIFKTGPSELGVHPTAGEWQGERYEQPRHHLLSLMCDDLDATIDDLRGRGAAFSSEPVVQGFGRTILLDVPGADPLMLYEPSHPTAFDR